MKCDWHQLGEYIEPCDERNGAGRFRNVLGLNKNREFMPTAANLEGVDLERYKIVREGGFVFSGMQTGRDVCIRLGLSSSKEPFVVSPAYETFRLKANVDLLPQYLFLIFNRSESDRLGWFLSDSSVRSNLDWGRFVSIKIPVPKIDEQRRVVDVWQGLRRMKEENELIAEPLMALCRSYMQEVKKKYHYASLADYIVRCEEKNSSGKYGEEDLLGVNSQHEFCPTRATTQGVDMKQYQIVHGDQFVYNPARLDIGSIALFKGKDCIVSTLYEIFKIKPEAKDELLSDYLMLWYERGEFARYVGFTNWGSAREYFWLDSMMRVKIPLPPKEVQESVVAVYRAAMEAKRIAAEADELSRQICPALVQHVVQGGK